MTGVVKAVTRGTRTRGGNPVQHDLRILRQVTFRHVFLARAVSLLGTSMAPVALAFAAQATAGSPPRQLPDVWKLPVIH
jgi:hypothetical protein